MATIGALGGELNLLARHSHTIGPFQVDATNSDGTPIDFTGATFDSVIKESWNTDAVDSFDVSVSSPETSGSLVFELPQTRCALLTEGGKYVYLISVTMAGKKNPFLYGSLELRGA